MSKPRGRPAQANTNAVKAAVARVDEAERVIREQPVKLPDPINLDKEQAFMLFATFCGDAERTAHALGVQAIDVLRLADAEAWLVRLAPIIAMRKSSRPGDVERAINRAINFVDAHRFRIFLQRIITHFTSLSTEDAVAAITSTKATEAGLVVSFNAKPFADLATAIEKMQALTYTALNDTVTERSRRKPEEDSEHSAIELQTKLDAAMQAAGASESPRAILFDAQLKLAQTVPKET